MVKKCCISKCRSEFFEGCGISFYQFPCDPDLLIKWLEACNRTGATKNVYVCSVHFKEEDLLPSPNSTVKRLKPGAIPCYNLPNTMVRPQGREVAVPSVCVSIKGERYLQIPPLVPIVSGDPSDQDPLKTDTKPSTSDIIISLAPINNQTEFEDHNYFKTVSAEIKYEPDVDRMEEAPAYSGTNMALSTPAPGPSVIKPAIDNSILSVEVRKYKSLSDKRRKHIELLQKQVKSLRQKVRRSKSKIDNMKAIITTVKRYVNRSEIDNILKGRFKELCDSMQKCEPQENKTEKEKVKINKGYSIDVIKFAISLYYISPKAYELVRRYMDLPQTKMLKKHIEKDTFTVINMDD